MKDNKLKIPKDKQAFIETHFIETEEDMPDTVLIPEIMFQPTRGEKPYVYYEKSEVDSWFGEYSEHQISRCENAINLFNIAFLLGYGDIEIYGKIIRHPLCDKGIALMVFRHLKTYGNPYGIEEISKEIIRKLEYNTYKEVLRYDPNKDTEVNMQRKAKWTIPEKMRKAIT